jgi:hypothetical protein
MVGLMPQQPGMQPPMQAEESAAPEMGMEAEEEQSNVAPEEQQAYDKFVGNAYRLMYDDKVMPQVVEALKGDGQPVEGLANAATMVATRLFDAAEQEGEQIPDDVKYHGAVEIIEDLANLQKEAGIADLDEKQIEEAVYRALDIYKSTQEQRGTLDKEGYQQDFQEIQQMAQSGELDSFVNGGQAPQQPQGRGLMQGGM